MAVSSADKKKLGKWIKQAREKKQPHLSQRQLALAVDITNASLSSIESGMIFPSEELLLKLIEQLQPPPELREKMLALFAKAKGTSPPDINAELSKNPKLWGLIRQLFFHDFQHHPGTQLKAILKDQAVCIGLMFPHTIGVFLKQFFLLVRHSGFKLFFVPADQLQ